MLNIRTDRLANWLLYLAVLLGVIGTTAHAETTQLGALRQEIVAAAERSLAEMQCGPAGLGAEASLQPGRVDCRGGVKS